MLGTRNIVNLQLYLGYKMNPSVNLYLYQIVSDLMQKDVIDEQPQKYTTVPGRIVGNFSVLAIQEVLSPDTRVDLGPDLHSKSQYDTSSVVRT